MKTIKPTLIGAALLTAAALSGARAFAQVDLTGWWANRNQQDNSYAQEPVEYLGIPFNQDGRARALSYNIAALSVTERQCQVYTPFYSHTGPFGLQITAEADPITYKLVAWNIAGWIDRDATQIWMDGRPHPSKNAPHTHGGFTTGEWQGDTLVTSTTHFKVGDIKRHRGFNSEDATITYYFSRHGDILTVLGIMDDPAILAEPYALTSPFRLDPTGGSIFPPTACEPIEELPYLHQNLAFVPHYLPGKNPFVNELTKNRNIPIEATLGGPETMYPEFRKQLKDKYVLPPPCKSNCGGPPNPQPVASPAAAPRR
jgi:hypothetical protein